MPEAPLRLADADRAAEEIVRRLGKDLRVGLPLGLGKPVTLLNALTRRAVEDPEIRLTIFTALTLERPDPGGGIQGRFLTPGMDRLFGAYPQIDYARMLREGTLPPNIAVREFFFLAGRWLGVAPAQQDYISVNYSHARDVLLAQAPNLILQLVSAHDGRLSLSANPDISADLMEMRRDGRLQALFAGEVNAELPFMEGAAAFDVGEADLLLEPETPYELFSAVKRPVDDAAHAIGLHVSRLVPDGGTLQIGIGAIGDAVAHALLLRQRGEIAEIHAGCPLCGDGFDDTAPFEAGLYSVTEMLVDGLLQLFEAGVIRREVDGAAVHAGFFVESRDFYARLRDMAPERRAKIGMAPVSYTNRLLGDEVGKRAARRGARFVNAAMKVTLLGAVNSDTRSDGQVVSGVGGQHDFVTQAHALEDGRSIITLPATRRGSRGLESNIVWDSLPETVPRHLRDIVVTEYGVADLRGRTDAEVIAALLEVADSRFQQELLEKAQAAGKIGSDHEIPEARRSNLPETVEGWLRPFRGELLPDFPFGTDFDETERRLLPALDVLRQAQGSRLALARLVWEGLRAKEAHRDALRRMDLHAPGSLSEHVTAAALAGALTRTGKG